jgi:hypothetical protein
MKTGTASIEGKIKGGYYLKAKRIQQAAIMHAPPHVREIWDWILMKAVFSDGDNLKRGQVLASYDDIRDALSWNIGYRKQRYSKWDCEKAMKWLTKEQMITTTKTTRGLIITICKYDYYQNPKNYESHTESHKKTTTKPQCTDTIVNEVKEVKEDAPSSVKAAIDYFSQAVQTKKGFKPKITGKDGAIVKSSLKTFFLPEVTNQIDFFLDNKKSENHISIAAALSADSYNTYMLAWSKLKWQHGDSPEPPTDTRWWQ